jgi:acyl-CoA thioesterase I
MSKSEGKPFAKPETRMSKSERNPESEIRSGFPVWALVLVLIWVAGMDAKSGDVTADPKTYLAEVTSLFQRHWPTNRMVHIVCHGHSVPAGYFKTPVVDTFNAYPHLLHRGLKERFPFAVLNVTVTAIGGEESESGAKRFERDVLSLRPDVVTIDYALNDRRIGLARAEAAWRSMITNATARGIKVLLLTPTPDQRAKLDDPNDPLLRHAEQVRRLARECGVGLVDSLADYQRVIREGRPLPDLMSQVNHPNRAGHDLVAAALLRWVPIARAKP